LDYVNQNNEYGDQQSQPEILKHMMGKQIISGEGKKLNVLVDEPRIEETCRNIAAWSRIIFNWANICLHINIDHTCFLFYAPHFDLKYTTEAFISYKPSKNKTMEGNMQRVPHAFNRREKTGNHTIWKGGGGESTNKKSINT
jgi:hypothetical protein